MFNRLWSLHFIKNTNSSLMVIISILSQSTEVYLDVTVIAGLIVLLETFWWLVLLRKKVHNYITIPVLHRIFNLTCL